MESMTLQADDNEIQYDEKSIIVVGEELGEGGFNQVSSIQKITFSLSQPEGVGVINKKNTAEIIIAKQGEGYQCSTCVCNECTCTTPYVLKRIRTDMSSSDNLIAVRDLAREAKILSELKHKNIIRCFYNGNSGAVKEKFIILERCDKSLDFQIALWDRHQRVLNNLYQEMMVEQQRSVSTDISAAMNYLHGKR